MNLDDQKKNADGYVDGYKEPLANVSKMQNAEALSFCLCYFSFYDLAIFDGRFLPFFPLFAPVELLSACGKL